MVTLNQNPEQIARDNIDKMLSDAGWLVQSKSEIHLSASLGVAVREYQTDIGPADYVLFVDSKPVGIIEAKREEEGHRLTTVEEQSTEYANAKLKYLNNDPLPFVYESTGVLTSFTDYRDPKARGHRVFHFHKPETLALWLKKKESLRERLLTLPELNKEGLRPAQIVAIENLEQSFKNNRPCALIQMATGAGKTFTAATFIYRLLKFADAKRILFLVDTRNLGEQAEQEFMTYKPNDDNRKFTELYNVQRLSSGYIADDSQVCISTIQRLYSILKGEELDESAENDNPNESTWLQQQLSKKQPMPVGYSPDIPIEQFDFIVIDECHRSIYNLWKQVLDYFDAFLIGLTATPDNRTYGFFNENVVSQYTLQESVLDGVNVPYDIYSIETEITTSGAKIEAGWFVDRRDKLTREKRWQQEDEDTEYKPGQLDKKVVNISQIRNIIKEFKTALQTQIFPQRFDENGDYEVPKTLVFAKTDSHADDIIKVIREEFNESNEFCKKVTYKTEEDPKSVLNRFRNAYYPRIAVTVDMIATGTDVKPLEVLLFMRDVRSKNYFEQMLGRGTRTINSDSLQLVTRTAINKTHFVIVDAVGATKSKKTDSPALERKPHVLLKDLLGAVTMGVQEEDLFMSLANRLLKLERQLTDKEKDKLLEHSNGKNLQQITKELISAYDLDELNQATKQNIDQLCKDKARLVSDISPEELSNIKTETQNKLIKQASSTFNGKLNEYIENVRKEHEQIIDHINLDKIKKSEWGSFSEEKARETIQNFTQYLEQNKDEIQALSIYYNQPYNRRHVTFEMMQAVLDKLKTDKPNLAPHYVWDAYTQIEKVNGKSPIKELTALVSLIRHTCGIDKELMPYNHVVDHNFKNWVWKKHSGAGSKFNEQQMEWLRMIKDHITGSFHIDIDDLDYTPFDAQGGRGKMFQLFGIEMEEIINELNEVLVA